jgi:hypothetical protein
MSDFPRYTRIKEMMEHELQRKTSWGRNEITHLLSSVLSTVADEEISFYQAELQDYIDHQDPDEDGEDWTAEMLAGEDIKEWESLDD